MEVNKLNRKFILARNNESVELADPNPSMQPKDVLSFYAASGYPELNNATVIGPVIKDDMMTFTFKTVVGTKG